MAMIMDQTKTGTVLDWEDKARLHDFILDCWNRHTKGELNLEKSDISRFTRRNLTRQMAELFNTLTK